MSVMVSVILWRGKLHQKMDAPVPLSNLSQARLEDEMMHHLIGEAGRKLTKHPHKAELRTINTQMNIIGRSTLS